MIFEGLTGPSFFKIKQGLDAFPIVSKWQVVIRLIFVYNRGVVKDHNY